MCRSGFGLTPPATRRRARESCKISIPAFTKIYWCRSLLRAQVRRAPVKGEKKKAFFANSGAEADENAVKIAKAFTGRENIIVFSGTSDNVAAYSGSVTPPQVIGGGVEITASVMDAAWFAYNNFDTALWDVYPNAFPELKVRGEEGGTV